jgi:uncharacterized damage-inducible protein DinB
VALLPRYYIYTRLFRDHVPGGVALAHEPRLDRHGGAGAELVSALDTRRGMDGVAEGTKLVHIAAQGAAGDFEAAGQVRPGPIPAALKEREKPKQARGGFQHEIQFGIELRTKVVRNREYAFRMTTCQTITLDFDDEMKSTRKLLERVPLDDAHRGYKPHEKSMPLERLATHVAELPSWLKLALDSEVLDLPAGFKPRVAATTAELLEIFDKSAEEGRAAIAGATETEMQKNWTFKFSGQAVFTHPRPNVIRSFINHLVHHRAQLGVYLRLNGIAIPGMYGPSADDGWPPR